MLTKTSLGIDEIPDSLHSELLFGARCADKRTRDARRTAKNHKAYARSGYATMRKIALDTFNLSEAQAMLS